MCIASIRNPFLLYKFQVFKKLCSSFNQWAGISRTGSCHKEAEQVVAEGSKMISGCWFCDCGQLGGLHFPVCPRAANSPLFSSPNGNPVLISYRFGNVSYSEGTWHWMELLEGLATNSAPIEVNGEFWHWFYQQQHRGLTVKYHCCFLVTSFSCQDQQCSCVRPHWKMQGALLRLPELHNWSSVLQTDFFKMPIHVLLLSKSTTLPSKTFTLCSLVTQLKENKDKTRQILMVKWDWKKEVTSKCKIYDNP